MNPMWCELTVNMNLRRYFRFSLRQMLWCMTLVSVSLGAWKICEQRAISDVQDSQDGWTAFTVLPYVLRVPKSDNVTIRETYHLWAFGYVARLPFSTECPVEFPVILTVQPRIIIRPEEELVATSFDQMR